MTTLRATVSGSTLHGSMIPYETCRFNRILKRDRDYECIEENILHDILLAHKSEVKEMVLTEFDAEKHDRHIGEQGERKERNRNKSLTLMMKHDGRQAELLDALVDDEHLRRLYEEHGLLEQ